jgi:amphi-Trp domain-containing protein
MATKKKSKKKVERDIERDYPKSQFVAKLRRLADCLEQGKRFQIQIAGERVTIPAGATINLEHERSGSEEEVEFQLTWSREPASGESGSDS